MARDTCGIWESGLGRPLGQRMGAGNLIESNCLDLASLGLEGNKTWRWRGARRRPHLLELPVYISSAHTAFSRLLAQLPHILSLSTPSLLPGAPMQGHCCPDGSATALGERTRNSKGPEETRAPGALITRSLPGLSLPGERLSFSLLLSHDV